MRPALPWILNAVAGVFLLFGLVAPLTPSEGYPAAPEMVVFAGLPVVLCLWAAVISRNWPARLVSIIQTLVIVRTLVWLHGLLTGGAP
jgi:hypothetical protein